MSVTFRWNDNMKMATYIIANKEHTIKCIDFLYAHQINTMIEKSFEDGHNKGINDVAAQLKNTIDTISKRY
jgi:hypothetical protein